MTSPMVAAMFEVLFSRHAGRINGNKLCRVDFFVFESWQTAEEVMVLPCNFNAVCHDSKTKKTTRQTFFNFQKNHNEGK
jgi:hypothetical protein